MKVRVDTQPPAQDVPDINAALMLHYAGLDERINAGIEAYRKALEAGVNQFGGESCPELVVELVKAGRVSEARLDQSVRRLLRLKFQLAV